MPFPQRRTRLILIFTFLTPRRHPAGQRWRILGRRNSSRSTVTSSTIRQGQTRRSHSITKRVRLRTNGYSVAVSLRRGGTLSVLRILHTDFRRELGVVIRIMSPIFYFLSERIIARRSISHWTHFQATRILSHSVKHGMHERSLTQTLFTTFAKQKHMQSTLQIRRGCIRDSRMIPCQFLRNVGTI